MNARILYSSEYQPPDLFGIQMILQPLVHVFMYSNGRSIG